MILLDTSAVRAFWNNHTTLLHLVERANHGDRAELHVPAVCLMEAETLLPGSGLTILEQPGIAVVPLGHLAVATGILAHEQPELSPGMAHAIVCAAPDPSGPLGGIIVTTEAELYPYGVVAVDADHPGLR
ncbi:hypothetical protein [Streptacidiphilus rugosus]|uniref:hypothetical protein n=1 Tax=Streptacidiphilus rugosus TaxID=405783 RepID=UPI000562AF35|nr:hypothetical protein [Streptacidiphilus rugosus]